ncbi:restriction endonuclease [Oceanobacillus sojae]|uniref:Restriction endonuclease n=1 Tax=Oceanobacillus sojae TaxID=582851 RepID=A0A511ZQP7_9BACI|nr:restriction endonuclease [Oceanobacillus sojae]GEN89774.1 restriction endonuclease [Oceanobacillus sojae]
MYRIEIKHEGLNKYREIKGKDFHVVQQKAIMQELDWKEKWRKKQEMETKRAEREKVALEKEEKKNLAIQLTVEAAEQLEGIENTLTYTLRIDDRINWEDLKDLSEYDVMEPIKPHLIEVPKEPRESHLLYQPKFNILDKMFGSLKEKKIEKVKELFQSDYKKWEEEKQGIELKNKERMEKYEEFLHGWEKERKEFLTQQKEKNDAIDLEKEMYFKKVPAAIVDYCDMVLSNSVYPDTFPQEFDIEFNNETKILIVDYVLPSPTDVPNLKEVKYIQSRDEFKEMYLSQAAFNKMYDKLLYQITLRSIHELYEADGVDAIESIVFNGWVNSIDKATGKDVNACILSMQAMKSEFMEIDLSKVDPKMCFKNLKGVGSSKLSSLSPIAPIIKLDRNDPRFVSAYDIADTLDDTGNLAAMDWQDFEQLIRELFEKEFNQSGGEVKITRASRDGGVDAVAFDPDPIRGGKIVIQAKRYTNVVGVSAVRDLYGTVMNEGATKGILVSTADYGPDAYEFSKGKPLTLLNGNNLLHLLQKHGHRAKIDLKEAKQILSDKI